MPIPIVCPNGHHMTLPDNQAGTNYRCPLCLTHFEVPGLAKDAGAPVALQSGSPPAIASAAPPSAAKGDDERAEQKRRLGRVSRGLGLHYARLLVLLFSIFGLVLVALGTDIVPEGILSALALVIGAALFLLGPVLGLIGSVLCFWIPPESRARGLIVLMVLVDLVPYPLGYIFFIGPVPADMKILVVYAVAGLQVVSWMLFALFLRQLSRYLGQEGLAIDAARLLVIGLCLTVLPVLLWLFLAGLVASGIGPVALAGSIAVSVVWIWALFALFREDMGCLTLVFFAIVPFGFIAFFALFLLKQVALIRALRQVIQVQE